MMRAIRNLFRSGKAVEVPTYVSDPRVAAAALLVEAALADGVFAEVEQQRILDVLAAAFGVAPDEGKAILAAAEEANEAAIDAWRFTSVVKTLGYPARTQIIEGLFRVANADGDACAFEDAFIRHVASLLHVTDTDRALARERAGRPPEN